MNVLWTSILDTSDYAPVVQEVTFQPSTLNTSLECFNVTIEDDATVEAIETFYLEVLTNDSAIFPPTTNITVEIVDNDGNHSKANTI